ncbi:MAG: LysM peptidoglycan-binding domain-containing protein [Anaerolineae bacterium]|nr:LysM peptidoglycan-binding domain-containing protein [Anaerolineae bacterium]
MNSYTHEVAGESGAGHIICPKCQARNPPTATVCAQCGGDLLPGRTIGQRIVRFLLGCAVAAICAVLGGVAARQPGLALVTWVFFIQALVSFFGSLAWALTRTPAYERYTKRAQRHLTEEPHQALSDLATALGLVPEKLTKVRAAISQQIATLSAQLGVEPPPALVLASLPSTSGKPGVAPESGARKGCFWVALCGAAFFVLLFLITMWTTVSDHARGVTTAKLAGGLYVAILSWLALLLLGLIVILLAQRKGLVALLWGASLIGALAIGAVVVTPRIDPQELKSTLLGTRVPTPRPTPRAAVSAFTRTPIQPLAPPTPTAPPVYVAFQEEIFSFEYPSDWRRIGQEETETLLKTALKGAQPEQLAYVGGVYTGGVENAKDCAMVVLLIVKNAAFPGGLTDEQYQQAEQAARRQMGTRLVSYRQMNIGSIPAVESVHVGASRLSQLRDVTIFPAEPGVVYMVSCSSHKDCYDDYAAVFERVVSSLSIAGSASPGPAEAVAPTATPETYVVQAGDTLGRIAAQYGVTVEAMSEANGIEDPNKIEVGQVLTIPAPGP